MTVGCAPGRGLEDALRLVENNMEQQYGTRVSLDNLKIRGIRKQ